MKTQDSSNVAPNDVLSSPAVGYHYGTYEGESNVGFMFLVEVALGRESSITQCKCSLTKAPNGYDSVVARGSCEPGNSMGNRSNKNEINHLIANITSNNEIIIDNGTMNEVLEVKQEL